MICAKASNPCISQDGFLNSQNAWVRFNMRIDLVRWISVLLFTSNLVNRGSDNRGTDNRGSTELVDETTSIRRIIIYVPHDHQQSHPGLAQI